MSDPDQTAPFQSFAQGPGEPTQAGPPYDPPTDQPNDPPPSDDRPRWAAQRDGIAIALGVAFLAGAIVTSASRSRTTGDLEMSVFLVGVVAAGLLLAFGVVARYAARHHADPVGALASWPLALGVAGAGLMLGVALDDGDSTVYVVGVAVILLAAAAYAVAPSAPPAVAGIIGVLLVYVQGFTDTVDVEVAEDNGFKTAVIAVTMFVLLVTAIGMSLPPARTTVAIVVGAGAIVAFVGIVGSLALSAIFFGFSSDFDDVESGPPAPPDFTSDVYLTFALAGGLVVVWLALGYVTGSPGFKALVVGMVATVYPAGLGILAVEHPTRWALAALVIGAAVLAVVGAGALRQSRTSSRSAGV